jgi:ATP-dependent DNA helicase DinG
VRWLETRPRSFTLHRTPLDVAPGFRAQMERFASAWVFTSATLTVAGRFEFYARRAGVDDADFRSFDSPFDYAQQALLYIPQLASDPRDPSYADALVEVTLPVVRASRGRTFFLFTSHRALQHARALLEGRLPYPILVQGSAPRAHLLERFRELGNAVLLGTSSFWEGVDVRGPALSCVIIDKLPFAPPEDPVLKARIRHMREQGDNPFTNYQLPQAVLALKQGVGRLIRDVTDRGVLVLCDPRLYSKPYGRVFRESLPAVPVTRELVEVEDFYADDAAADSWP